MALCSFTYRCNHALSKELGPPTHLIGKILGRCKYWALFSCQILIFIFRNFRFMHNYPTLGHLKNQYLLFLIRLEFSFFVTLIAFTITWDTHVVPLQRNVSQCVQIIYTINTTLIQINTKVNMRFFFPFSICLEPFLNPAGKEEESMDNKCDPLLLWNLFLLLKSSEIIHFRYTFTRSRLKESPIGLNCISGFQCLHSLVCNCYGIVMPIVLSLLSVYFKIFWNIKTAMLSLDI